MGERSTRDGATVGKPTEVLPEGTAAGSFAAIREKLADTRAGVSLHDIMVEFHGPVEGSRLYAAAVQSRETAARRVELEAALADARIAAEAEIAEAERALEALRCDADVAKGRLAEILDQVTSQWVHIQQLHKKHDTEAAQIRERFHEAPPDKGPSLPVWAVSKRQWETPPWAQPLNETPLDGEIREAFERRNGGT